MGGEFSGQANSEESQSGEEMVGPVLETLRPADGLRDERVSLEAKKWAQTLASPFLAVRPMATSLTPLQACFPSRKTGTQFPGSYREYEN